MESSVDFLASHAPSLSVLSETMRGARPVACVSAVSHTWQTPDTVSSERPAINHHDKA